MLEITNGLNIISLLESIDFIEKLPVAALVLGFGGFSVHMQVASIISDTDLSIKPYLLGKLLQGIFASICTFLLMKFTNFFSWDVVESFSYSSSNMNVIKESSNLLLILLMTISFGIVIQIFRKIMITLKNN